MVGQSLVDFVDGHVEIEKQSSLAVVAHHALHPEKSSQSDAARHRRDVMQAARRVDHHVPGRKFHRVRAVNVVDDQFAAVVLFRRR